MHNAMTLTADQAADLLTVADHDGGLRHDRRVRCGTLDAESELLGLGLVEEVAGKRLALTLDGCDAVDEIGRAARAA